MATFKEYIRQVKGQIREVTPDDVARRVQPSNGGGAPVVIDVREKDEYAQGFVPGATWIPRGFLEPKIEEAVPDKNREIVLYCAGGTRSALAAKALGDLGYANVVSMSGGFGKWKELGLPFAMPKILDERQTARYSRHVLIPEVGERGQLKLLDSKVLLIGAGGLGSPAAFYLAAAGVGRLGIVDSDVVDESNLQRQILHRTSGVGMPKTDSARQTLRDLNPSIDIVPFQTRLTKDNALDIVRAFDVVVDGCDNFSTRFLVNDACVFLKKPNVYGSIFRFEGQMTIFVPGEGPCYRCLYPEPTPAELAPSCQDAGCLGVLPGVIGILQATEAIKRLIGAGTSMAGRLLTYDALSLSFREYKIRRDPSCPVCGDSPTITKLVEYEESCATAPPRQ
ncbi:MAG: molybdopterin-synthase adenylyltransferase MoeB [Planctomycetes bacterium]|nr:molybdopterin-synthase adenylyltransferase MoeB [Planctomycetota bacterium]MBI3848481.1 molybdopterin-synthase adenylyltransferase MoeB [Planctomycetota bacterium]